MNAFIEHFQLMARYNRLANERLYDSCASVSDDERKRPRKAFFTSIHGTLNHIVTGDRIWMTRFEGGEAPSTGLDAILYDDFGELRAARAIEDQRIDRFVEGLDAAFLEGAIAYINNQGKLYIDPVRALLPHFFNHQTHHRGQVHDMLSQAGVRTPV